MDKRKATWDSPDIQYSLHTFDSSYLTVGVGHYRTAGLEFTGEGVTPRGLGIYDDKYVVLAEYNLYLANTLLTSLASYDSMAVLDDVLYISDGTTIYNYDGTYGFNVAGMPAATTSDTPTITEGLIEPVEYSVLYTVTSYTPCNLYYRFTYEDAYGAEGVPSDAVSVQITGLSQATFTGVPYLTTGEYPTYSHTNIYRTYGSYENSYDSTYHLVGTSTDGNFTDNTPDEALTDSLKWGITYGNDYGYRPAGKNLKAWHPFLTWTTGNTLCISALDDYGRPLAGMQAITFPIGDDSDIITTALFGKNLAIFKATGIYVITPYENIIYTLTTTFGVSSARHVIEYKNTVLFWCHRNVYNLDNLKSISEAVEPIFGEYTTIGDVWLMTDHYGRVYVVTTVTSDTNPTYANTKYVAYIFYNSWFKQLNFDVLYMVPDYKNNRTLCLDKMCKYEIIDWTNVKCKSYSPAIYSTWTYVSTTQVTLSTVSTVELGDYLWIYDTGKFYTSRITNISGTTLTIQDTYFTETMSYIGIGVVYYAISGDIVANADTLDLKGWKGIVSHDYDPTVIAFGYVISNAETLHAMQLSDAHDSSNLVQILKGKRDWYIRPQLCGITYGEMYFNTQRLIIDKAGSK